MNNYEKFKCLLEYFVAYIRYVRFDEKDTIGYNKYIKKYVESNCFSQNEEVVQEQIKEWATYGGITIRFSKEFRDYGEVFFLYGDGFRIGYFFSVTREYSFGSLYVMDDRVLIKGYGEENLGLYDGQKPNEQLKLFFNIFMSEERRIKKEQKKIEYISKLKQSKNIIFTGIPGTGKTFLAREIAECYVGAGIYSSLSYARLQKRENFEFVQFHPSYDYTDFIEGLRPVKSPENGAIGFELKDGIFKKFCLKAMENPKKDFVFVIDEINRGEISKIFGELFFSIDPSYRGEKGAVRTQYSSLHEEENRFYVPENVYIIGTMNDIDRSVESFDFAMRRRFTWIEITAQESADNMGLSEEAREKMTNLNNQISQTEGLGSAYHIGGAYFLDVEGKSSDDFESIWAYRLEPLLKEYLRGVSNSEEKLTELKNVYYAD